MKRISFNLSIDSIQNAIKEVEKYQEELNQKVELLVQKLAESGLEVAKAVVGTHTHGTGETLASLRIELDTEGNLKRATLIGQSEALLFLEFGAGIHFNQDMTHPMASELGYGVGTYPGQIHSFDENGWYYLGDDGKWHHSYGIKADMPMYKSAQAMRNKILSIAKSVFQ